jgi:hypothetical protein
LPGLQLALLMASYEYMIGLLYKEKLRQLSKQRAGAGIAASTAEGSAAAASNTGGGDRGM